MKDCEECMMNTICTYYDKERKKTTGDCPGWRWFKKSWVVLLLCLLLAAVTGCAVKSYHRKAWDAQGNLIEQVDVCLADGVIKTDAQDILVVVDGKRRMLAIGNFSQVPDADMAKSGLGFLLDLFLWKGVGL